MDGYFWEETAKPLFTSHVLELCMFTTSSILRMTFPNTCMLVFLQRLAMLALQALY